MRFYFFLIICITVSLQGKDSFAKQHDAFCRQSSLQTQQLFNTAIEQVSQWYGADAARELAVTLLMQWQKLRSSQRRKRIVIITVLCLLCLLGVGITGAVYKKMVPNLAHDTSSNTVSIIDDDERGGVAMMHNVLADTKGISSEFGDIFPDNGPDPTTQQRTPPGLRPVITFMTRHVSTMTGALRAAAHAGIAYAAVRPCNPTPSSSQEMLVRQPILSAPIENAQKEDETTISPLLVAAGGVAAGAVGGYLLAQHQQQSVDSQAPSDYQQQK